MLRIFLPSGLPAGCSKLGLMLELVPHRNRSSYLALAGLVNVLNPERVILGGGVAEGDTRFVDIVRETILGSALPVATDRLEVVAAQLGNAAGFIGAAMLGKAD